MDLSHSLEKGSIQNGTYQPHTSRPRADRRQPFKYIGLTVLCSFILGLLALLNHSSVSVPGWAASSFTGSRDTNTVASVVQPTTVDAHHTCEVKAESANAPNAAWFLMAYSNDNCTNRILEATGAQNKQCTLFPGTSAAAKVTFNGVSTYKLCLYDDAPGCSGPIGDYAGWPFICRDGFSSRAYEIVGIDDDCVDI